MPPGPYTWDPKLGGIIFPKWRQKVSTKWSGSSAGEVSVLTGRVWDTNASELLVQPLMYGKFMEYGHNGEVLNVRHVSLDIPWYVHDVYVDRILLCLSHRTAARSSFLGVSQGSGTLTHTPGRPDWAQACSLAGNMGCMRGNLSADVGMCGAAGNCVIAPVQA